MFNLSRYFSLLSFILIVLAAGALSHLYRELSVQQMSALAEDRNIGIAHLLQANLGGTLTELLQAADGGRTLEAEPAATEARRQALGLLRDTPVVGVYLLDRQGRVIFSGDTMRVQTSRGADNDLHAALSGTTRSKLMHRESFTALDGVRREVDLLRSFVPLDGALGLGVLELYQDVTPFMVQVNRTLWWVSAGVIAVFTVLYLLQFLVVRRAHRFLQEQEGRIEAARANLEIQVDQRTAELRQANLSLEAEVAERRQAESKLNYLAYHDPLTGLANRRAFLERLDQSIVDAGLHRQRLAVLFIDLDQFKQVNDTLGHPVGDELLVAVARRLAPQVRLIDLFARLGGDEFICLMEAVRDTDAVAAAARDFIGAFDQPFQVDEHALYLSTSIGICLYPDDGTDAGTLMRNADTAMYRAKALGRGHFHFYTADMTRDAVERIRIENLLRHALDRGELAVHLQPQVDAENGCLTGAEALVRWNSPELGQVSPERFIGLAEECGLIVDLGHWVLRETCRQVMTWRQAGFDLPQVSVNLSVKQLERPDFVDHLLAVLEETGLEPERLKLELTESVVMAVDDAFHLLARLRALGITLSIDDFGTGYSSLNYLKLLPIQQLKIDRSFVVGIGKNAGDEAIIRTVMALAHSLGLDVVAEGVETREQAQFLQSVGCQHLQGFLHGKALNPGEFRARWQGGH